MKDKRIHSKAFTQALIDSGLSPVVQVPCSYFKEFIDYLLDTKAMEVISPVNEAVAMGIAAGSYLSTGRIPIVAIQNSGFMNTLNALTSLQQIYSIPVFYIVTWRGEGGKGSDVPAHDVTGTYMENILKTFLLPFEIMDPENYTKQVQALTRKAELTKKPVALVLRKNTFQPYPLKQDESPYSMTRFEAMKIVKEKFLDDSILLSGTGYPSRDAYNIRDTPDFYVVGSMGHILSIGLGISPHTRKPVIVLDGDGSCLMHLGGLASFNPKIHKNLVYVVFDNESYESTGGQTTLSPTVDFSKIAQAFHFPKYYLVKDEKALKRSLASIQKSKQSAFLHIKVRKSTDASGPLPTEAYSSEEIKERFTGNFKNKK